MVDLQDYSGPILENAQPVVLIPPVIVAVRDHEGLGSGLHHPDRLVHKNHICDLQVGHQTVLLRLGGNSPHGDVQITIQIGVV